MKNIITYTLAATLVAGASASHHHQLRHARRHGSNLAKRGQTTVILAATETQYMYNGTPLAAAEAEKMLKDGDVVVVGETNPIYTAPAAPEPAPTTIVTSVSVAKVKAQAKAKQTEEPSLGAQFIESKEVSSAAPTTTEVEEAPSSTEAAAEPTKSKSASGGSSKSPSGQGLDSEFPSDIDCDQFPSDYGAIALDWLDLGGWSGIQYTDYVVGALSISTIDTAIAGQGCTKGAMCSYACPAGYQKTQWSAAQGSTGQSIGGLYCNSKGKLELTNPKFSKKLCEAGMGGMTVQNDLTEEVSTCRTDYPGTENMVIPAVASPGGTVDLCNPNQATYYTWQGSKTTAQYYINPKGVGKEKACDWSTKGSGIGNFAPLNVGVGYDDGNTYVGLFANLPSSTDELDFNVEILGGNAKCYYKNGAFGGAVNALGTGCTTTIPKGSKGVVRYF